MELIKNINQILNKKLKIYLSFIFLIIFVAMLLEAVSLASFYPLLEILSSNSEKLNESSIQNTFLSILDYFKIRTQKNFLQLFWLSLFYLFLKILILLF